MKKDFPQAIFHTKEGALMLAGMILYKEMSCRNRRRKKKPAKRWSLCSKGNEDAKDEEHNTLLCLGAPGIYVSNSH